MMTTTTTTMMMMMMKMNTLFSGAKYQSHNAKSTNVTLNRVQYGRLSCRPKIVPMETEHPRSLFDVGLQLIRRPGHSSSKNLDYDKGVVNIHPTPHSPPSPPPPLRSRRIGLLYSRRSLN